MITKIYPEWYKWTFINNPRVLRWRQVCESLGNTLRSYDNIIIINSLCLLWFAIHPSRITDHPSDKFCSRQIEEQISSLKFLHDRAKRYCLRDSNPNESSLTLTRESLNNSCFQRCPCRRLVCVLLQDDLSSRGSLTTIFALLTKLTLNTAQGCHLKSPYLHSSITFVSTLSHSISSLGSV